MRKRFTEQCCVFLLVSTANLVMLLLQVICCAEMKSKAELVVELDKMTKVREELTQEVSNLSAQVEQERSKVNQLTLDLKKYHVSNVCLIFFFFVMGRSLVVVSSVLFHSVS